MAGIINSKALSRQFLKSSKELVKKIDDFMSSPDSYTPSSISKSFRQSGKAHLNSLYKEYAKIYENLNPGAPKKEIKKAAINAVLKQDKEGYIPFTKEQLMKEESPFYEVPTEQTLTKIGTKDARLKQQPRSESRFGVGGTELVPEGPLLKETVDVPSRRFVTKDNQVVTRPAIAQSKSIQKPSDIVGPADDMSAKVRFSDELGLLTDDVGEIGGAGYVETAGLPGVPLEGQFIPRSAAIKSEKLEPLIIKKKEVPGVLTGPQSKIKGELRSVGGPQLDKNALSKFVFDKQTGLLKFIRDLNQIASGKEDKATRKANLEIGNIFYDLASRKQGETVNVAKKNKKGKLLFNKDGSVKTEKKYAAFSQDNPKNWNQVKNNKLVKDEFANYFDSPEWKNITQGKGTGLQLKLDEVLGLKEVDKIRGTQPKSKDNLVKVLLNEVLGTLMNPNIINPKIRSKTAEILTEDYGIKLPKQYKPMDITSKDLEGNIILRDKNTGNRQLTNIKTGKILKQDEGLKRPDYINYIINTLSKIDKPTRTKEQTQDLIKMLTKTTKEFGDPFEDPGQTYKIGTKTEVNPRTKGLERVSKDIDLEQERKLKGFTEKGEQIYDDTYKFSDEPEELTGDFSIASRIDDDTLKQLFEEDAATRFEKPPESGIVGAFSETGQGITTLKPDIKNFLKKYLSPKKRKELTREERLTVVRAQKIYLAALKEAKARKLKGKDAEAFAEETVLSVITKEQGGDPQSVMFYPEKMLDPKDKKIKDRLRKPQLRDLEVPEEGPYLPNLFLPEGKKTPFTRGTTRQDFPTEYSPSTARQGPPSVQRNISSLLKDPESYVGNEILRLYADILRRKRNLAKGGLAGLTKKKKFVPKIVKNKKLKKRKQQKPKGVGAALRGYGAICG